jgi:hypothetical protein
MHYSINTEEIKSEIKILGRMVTNTCKKMQKQATPLNALCRTEPYPK